MTTPETRTATNTLKTIGSDEMKQVAGGEVGAMLSALRGYCDSYGMSCTGNAELVRFMYGNR